jgi:hypothetical protein
MFNRQTLFILGAGSSYEAGLPVGKGLAKLIGAKMDIRFDFGTTHVGSGDLDLFNHVTHRARSGAPRYQEAAWLGRVLINAQPKPY